MIFHLNHPLQLNGNKMKFLKIFIIFFISNNLFSQSNYGNFVELKRLFIQEKYDLISKMDNNFDKKMNFIHISYFTKGLFI